MDLGLEGPSFGSTSVKPKPVRKHNDPRDQQHPIPPAMNDAPLLSVLSAVEGLLDTMGSRIEGRLLQQFHKQEECFLLQRVEDRKMLAETQAKLDQLKHDPQEDRGKNKKKRPGLPEYVADHPLCNFFLAYICDYLQIVLLKLLAPVQEDGMKNEQAIGPLLVDHFSPLSQTDYNNYCVKRPRAFKLSKDNFRFEFSRSLADHFNKEALHVAVEGFTSAMAAGDYPWMFSNGQPVPEIFFLWPHLSYMIEQHARHLFRQYREAKKPDYEEVCEECLKNVNCAVRRNHLYNDWLETARHFPQLKDFVKIVKAVGTDGTSEDESEHEVDNAGTIVCTKYMRVAPFWRSAELSNFLRLLDGYTARRKASNIG
ncbi:hypothetical protein H1R20_g9460, partial [Candolleomyces eurysporus]